MECYYVGIEMAVHQFVNCGHQSQSVIFSSVCFHCVNGIFFHVRYLCAFLKSVNQLIIHEVLEPSTFLKKKHVKLNQSFFYN